MRLVDGRDFRWDDEHPKQPLLPSTRVSAESPIYSQSDPFAAAGCGFWVAPDREAQSGLGCRDSVAGARDRGVARGVPADRCAVPETFANRASGSSVRDHISKLIRGQRQQDGCVQLCRVSRLTLRNAEQTRTTGDLAPVAGRHDIRIRSRNGTRLGAICLRADVRTIWDEACAGKVA